MKKRLSLYLGILAIIFIIVGIILPRELDTLRLILIPGGVILLLLALFKNAVERGKVLTCPTCNLRFEMKLPLAIRKKDGFITCPHCGTIIQNDNVN